MKATIVGLAREGLALAPYLVRHGHEVTITDMKPPEQLRQALASIDGLPIHLALGGHPVAALKEADIVYVSAGVRRDVAPFAGLPAVSSETELFFQECPAPIIGITGSAGKTTTTTLLGKMLTAKPGRGRVYVGGNIGRPLINLVDEMTAEDRVVLELSSFQLEYLQQSPRTAVVTNITPNHLDRHPTMQAYINAKAQIVAHQGANDIAILNEKDPESRALASRTRARVLRFNGQHAFLDGDRLCLRTHDATYEICRANELQIPGRHNIDNVLAASLAACCEGVSPQTIREVAIHFKGVEHRLQLVRDLDGVSYYNDSIATAPERTLAALAVFDQPIVLIAGGREKHLPLEGLAQVVAQKVKAVVLLGESAPLLEEAFEKVRLAGSTTGPAIGRASTIEEAVGQARKVAARGDVVLLSPACTSYDMFQDFEARGREFVRCVEGLG